MLDLDDIQHFLLTRPHALAARYEFLSFASPEAGRAWLAGILDTVGNARAVTDAADSDTRWVTVGIHLERAARARGRRILARDISCGVSRRHGRARRSARVMLGTTIPITGTMGWLVRTFTPSSFCLRATQQHVIDRPPSTRPLSPRAMVRACCRHWTSNPSRRLSTRTDHFGYRDKLSQPALEGPDAIKPGEFILGYPDEDGDGPHLPQPEVLSRNGQLPRLPSPGGARRRLSRLSGAARPHPEEQETGRQRS
jgi:hypothetical protein